MAAPAWSAPPAKAPAPAADPERIAPDPGVRRGVLPNGLRYLVMSNPAYTNLSIRLGIEAGGFDEDDDQRGAAHFLEHLAFDAHGEKAGRDLQQVFAAKGAAFGRDRNAETDLFATSYRLDLQHPDDETVGLAFGWMRDVADGLVLTDAAVERERGVVQSERQARLTATENASRAVIEFQLAGMRTGKRDPMGSAAEIAALNRQVLQRYYDRWYRPSNAVVVAVGAQSVDELERRIVAGFASWKGRGPDPVRAPLSSLRTGRGIEAMTLSEAGLPTVFSACALTGPLQPIEDRVERVRPRVTAVIWQTILNRRLEALVTQSEAPFLTSQVASTSDLREAAVACVVAAPLGDRWETAAGAAQSELRRFAAHGPTQEELDATLEEQRSLLRGAIVQTRNRQTPQLASQLLENELVGGVTPSPSEGLRLFEHVVEDMTPETVRADFNARWKGIGPLLTLLSPQPVAREAVSAAWTRGAAGEAPAQLAAVDVRKWSYASFGKPGKVARREKVKAGGFRRYTFRNGVVLNLKPTSLQRNDAVVIVNFGAGRREVSRADYMTALLAAGQFKSAGLRRHSLREIERIFLSESWDAELVVGEDFFELRGDTTGEALRHQLQILAAYVTDPGFDASFDARWPSAVDIVYQMSRTDPGAVMSDVVSRTLAPGGGLDLPPKAQIAALRSADFTRVLGGPLSEAPLEITIVGDIAEKPAIAAVAETFGALPPRANKPRPASDAAYLRFPQTPPPPIRVTHDGPAEKSLTGVFWPLYVASPERRREEQALMLLSAVLENRLIDGVRQNLGLSYAPEAATQTPDASDQGFLAVRIESDPAKADVVLREIRREAEALRKGEITAEMLERARQPILAGQTGAASTNAYWASVLTGSSREPARVADIIGMKDTFAAITLDEVKAVAARWLAAEPLVIVVSPKAPARATA